MTHPAPLQGTVVAILGARIASHACGALLARLGATVVFLETNEAARPAAGFLYGAYSVKWTQGETASALAVLQRADVVVMSPDVAGTAPRALVQAAREAPVVCDISAFGTGVSGDTADDAVLQGLSGIMEVTGYADGAPTVVGLPVVELSGALYAAISVMTALQEWESTAHRKRLDACLYDTAFNAMATFLPEHLGGGTPRRIGNQHPLSAPWDAFLADAWVLVCTVSDAQFHRLAGLIGRPDLALEPRLQTLPGRLAARDELHALVGGWVRAGTAEGREKELLAAGIPCGRVLRLRDVPHDPNLLLRGAVQHVEDRGASVAVPGGLSGAGQWWRPRPRMPLRGQDHDVTEWLPPSVPSRQKAGGGLPLEGIKVLEIGQYTTAPLVTRHLASLGAIVLKIEPREGDIARAYVPAQDGVSLFFAMSNSGKSSVRIDLASPHGRATFTGLVRGADVLVENLKPRALSKLGFSPEQLAAINPRLVYAAISGFGAHSLHAQRPAYDTVIQAMSGVMDATQVEGVPMKAGVSIADIAGGQMALLAVMGALRARQAGGSGMFLDVSMQDAAAWLTQGRWNEEPPGAIAPTAPAATVAQACASRLTQQRHLLVPQTDAMGRSWTLLGSPLSMSGRKPRVGPPIEASLEQQAALRWWNGHQPRAKTATEPAAASPMETR